MPTSFTFSNDRALIDRDLVHRWLSEESYWAKGRSRATQDAAIDASRNYSIRDDADRQVGYARVVTDGVTFAWLCDVFVDERARGHGIGRMLVEGCWRTSANPRPSSASCSPPALPAVCTHDTASHRRPTPTTTW